MSVQRFLNYIKFEKRYSEHTLSSYENDLSQFEVYLTQFKVTIEKADARLIRSWLIELMEDGLKPGSINRKMSSLKSYYKFLMREGNISVNPAATIKLQKLPERTPDFVDEKELMAMIRDLPEATNLEDLRDQCVFELFYSTGIRRSELIALNERDVDLHDGNIKVFGKGKKERKIPVDNVLLKKIKRYISIRNVELERSNFNSLFVNKKGNDLNPKTVYSIVRKYLSKCFSVDKKSPHVLRHTFATHMLNKGASLNSIKELLGHSSLAATQVYTHNSIERLKEVHKQAHPKA